MSDCLLIADCDSGDKTGRIFKSLVFGWLESELNTISSAADCSLQTSKQIIAHEGRVDVNRTQQKLNL